MQWETLEEQSGVESEDVYVSLIVRGGKYADIRGYVEPEATVIVIRVIIVHNRC